MERNFMTVNQIARYTALARRRSEILLLSGRDWKPEYTEELQNIDKEVLNLRKEMKLYE